MGSLPAQYEQRVGAAPSPPLDPLAVTEDLTPLPTLKAAGETQILFDGQLSRPLRLHEDVKTGCGGQTWPAGMLLGRHLLRYHLGTLQDARILELGAGGGLVGLGVALELERLGRTANKLLVTDQQEMLHLMRKNINLNQLEAAADALVLNWGETLPATVVAQKPNVIIAAECVYFEPAFPLLIQTLKDLLQLNEDAVVFVCFKKRRRADMQFIKMAKKAFRVQDLEDESRPVFQRENLHLFSIRKREQALQSLNKTKTVMKDQEAVTEASPRDATHET